MKPAILLGVIFAGALAGGAGGYVATQLAPEPARQQASRPAAIAPEATAGTDLGPAVEGHGKSLNALQMQVAGLESRLADAEAKAKSASESAASLKAELDASRQKLNDLESRPGAAVANGGSTDGSVAVPPELGTPEFKAAVDAAIKEREEQQRKERDAEREREMADRMAQANKSALDKMNEKLVLSVEQQDKIKTHLDAFSNARRDVMRRGMEARQAGTEFNWEQEMTTVNNTATEAVRAELSSAQLTTFNEMVGERGVSSLVDGRRGFGMGGGGGPGGGFGGRGN